MVTGISTATCIVDTTSNPPTDSYMAVAGAAGCSYDPAVRGVVNQDYNHYACADCTCAILEVVAATATLPCWPNGDGTYSEYSCTQGDPVPPANKIGTLYDINFMFSLY